MPYKGPVLAVQAYGDVALREFEDLDIILGQRDMASVNEIAKNLGYRPQHAWVFDSDRRSAVVPGEYDYRDQARGMVVEFHTELTLRHFPVRPDLDEMSRRLVPVMLSGHEIRTFAPEDMLPLLCIHGSKDFWERISWIADISEFVRSHPKLDWETVFLRANALRAGRMLRLGLSLAAKLLSAPLPEEVSASVRSDSVAEVVASEIVQRHLARETRERGAGERFQFRRRMVAGAIAGWRYSLRLATLPADEDSAAMRLPRQLAPLYALMRPFRLLRQYRPPEGSSERRDCIFFASVASRAVESSLEGQENTMSTTTGTPAPPQQSSRERKSAKSVDPLWPIHMVRLHSPRSDHQRTARAHDR